MSKSQSPPRRGDHDRSNRELSSEVRRAHSWLDALFNLLPDAAAMLDDRFRLIRVNPAFELMFGYTAEEALGRRVDDLIVPEGLRLEKDQATDRIIQQDQLSLTTIRRRKDGRDLHVAIHIRRAVAEDRLVGFLVVYNDLSGRRQTEEALRDSQERFHHFMDNFPGHAFIKDQQGRYIYSNANRSQGSPIDKKELIGRSDEQVFSPEAVGVYKRNDKLVLSSGQTVETMEPGGQAGSGRTYLSIKFPIPRDDGSTLLGGLSLDVSERVRAERALKASETKYRHLVEQARCIILRVAADGRIAYINEYGEQFFGYRAEELIGRSVVRTILPERDALGRNLIDMLTDVLDKPDRFKRNRNENMTKDGRRVWVSWSNNPIYDRDGQLIEILSVGSDVTEQKKAEEALAARLGMEQITAATATRAGAAGVNELDELIAWTIERIGRFARVDRSYFFQFSEDQTTINNTHEWCAPGIEPQISFLQDLPVESAPWTTGQLMKLQVVHIPLVANLPVQAAIDKEMLAAQDIQSLILAPLVINERCYGFMGFDSVRETKTWTEPDILLLRTVTEILASAMTRIRTTEALSRSEQRYRQLVESASMGIFSLQTDGRISQTNNQFIQIVKQLGYYDNQGISLLEFPPLVDSGVAADLAECIKSGVAIINRRPVVAEDGKVFHYRYHLNPLCDENEEIIGVEGLVENVTELIEAEMKLKENEQYLATLLETIKAGVMIIDRRNRRIVDLNDHAARMIGLNKRDVIGRICHQFVCPAEENNCPVIDLGQTIDNSERVLLATDRTRTPILKSVTSVERQGRELLVESFIDVSELKQLVEAQKLDAASAKRILTAINGPTPRDIDLADRVSLFVSPLSLPCNTEGGDHYFISRLPAGANHPAGRTIVSLKDQSGHLVGCLLKSIITDLIHQSIVRRDDSLPVAAAMDRLNLILTMSDLLSDDDFITAAVLEIDHATMETVYVSCGHPRFLVIRGGGVLALPRGQGRAGSNPPLGLIAGRPFTSGRLRLMPGDRIILYTDGLTEAAVSADGAGEGCVQSVDDLIGQVEEMLTDRPDLPVEEIVDGLLAWTSKVSGRRMDRSGTNETGDDVSMIGLEVEDWSRAETTVWRPTDPGRLQAEMDRFLDEHLARWDSLSYTKPMRLQLCLEEAAANAWRHGNRRDPAKTIELRWRYGNDFHLEITDQGRGFDPDDLPDCREGENRLKESGRGVFVIRQQADRAVWSRGGTRLTMTFRRQPGSLMQDCIYYGDRGLRIWPD